MMSGLDLSRKIQSIKNFLLFMKVLERVLQADLNQNKVEYMILMDNATIHFSKTMKKAYRSLALRIRFLSRTSQN